MRVTAKEMMALTPVGFWGLVRRAFGFFTDEEKEVLNYARRVKRLGLSIAKGHTILQGRPEWLRQADYQKMRALQKNVTEKKLRGKRVETKKVAGV